MPDAAGEVAFEAAHRLEAGLAFGALAGQLILGLGVAAGAGECDAVDCGVELAVAAAVQTVSLGLAGADGNRRDAGRAGELGFSGKAVGAGDLAQQLARGQRPKAGLGEQLRRVLGGQLGDLGLERVGSGRQIAQSPQLVAGDSDARGLLGAREAPADPA